MKKSPIIRHVRWLVANMRFRRWWNSVGCYLGAFPNKSDQDYLDAIWRGKA